MSEDGAKGGTDRIDGRKSGLVPGGLPDRTSECPQSSLSDMSDGMEGPGGSRNLPRGQAGGLRRQDLVTPSRHRRRARQWEFPVGPTNAPAGPNSGRDGGGHLPQDGVRRRRTLLPDDFELTDESEVSRRRRRWLSPQRVLQEVRRWGVTFSDHPHEDVEDFLSLIEEGRSLIPIRDEDLIKTLSFCLSGMARMWYREERRLLTDWEAAKAAFRGRFSDPDYQIALREEIMSRTQGNHESVLVYLSCMNGLFSRLSPPWTELERVRYAYRNMLPPFKIMISYHDHLTMRDLEREAGRRERVIQSLDSRRPPPRPEASLCPSFAYRETRMQVPHAPRRARVNAAQELDVEAEYQSPLEEVEEPFDFLRALVPSRVNRGRASGERPQPPTSRAAVVPPLLPNPSREASPRQETTAGAPPALNREGNAPRVTAVNHCWNCDQPGHRHRECKESRRLFCYRCGLSGVTSARCTHCNRGNA